MVNASWTARFMNFMLQFYRINIQALVIVNGVLNTLLLMQLTLIELTNGAHLQRLAYLKIHTRLLDTSLDISQRDEVW